MQESAGIEAPRGGARHTLRLLAFGVLGVVLLAGVVAHSLVAALVEIDPKLALAIRSDDPAALIALADRVTDQERARRAANASRPSDSGATLETDEALRRERNDDLRRWATAALAQEPGNARALAILGDLARQDGADDVARTLLGASARRSAREPLVLGWLIDDALKQRDWLLAVRNADTMMRYYPQSIAPLSLLFAHLLQDPESAPAVREAVAAGPPWRRGFLPTLLNAMTDARIPLELLLALKETPNPPTLEELQGYLRFLISRQYFDLAYYTWLQFLSPDQRARVEPLFNGSFEHRLSGLQFDWVMTRARAADAGIERRTDRPAEHALVIRLDHGRAELDYIAQVLRLQPGRYRIEGTTTGELRGARGMRWRVRCLVAPKSLIGESAMLGGRIASWTEFSFDVTVPEVGCAAQELRLILDARTASEQLVTGVISFDELSVRREP